MCYNTHWIAFILYNDDLSGHSQMTLLFDPVKDYTDLGGNRPLGFSCAFSLEDNLMTEDTNFYYRREVFDAKPWRLLNRHSMIASYYKGNLEWVTTADDFVFNNPQHGLDILDELEEGNGQCTIGIPLLGSTGLVVCP